MDELPKLTDIFTFENLLRAFKKSAKGRRKKKDTQRFKENLYQNIGRIVRTFKRGEYPKIEYHSFTVYEPKQRVVWATSFEIRVVINCFCEECLIPFFEPLYADTNSASRKGMGTDYAKERLVNDLNSYYVCYGNNEGWFLKMDVRKYFNSIDHDDLKRILNEIIPESEVKDFLFYIIDSFPKGIPLGNRTSQLMALYYLNFMDEMATNEFGFTRANHYMDDMIILDKDKQRLEKFLNVVQIRLGEERHLELNNRTVLAPIKTGIGYMGWNFYLKNNGKVLAKRKKTAWDRTKKKMKNAAWLYQTNQIDARNYSGRVCSLLQSLHVYHIKGEITPRRYQAKGLKHKLVHYQKHGSTAML